MRDLITRCLCATLLGLGCTEPQQVDSKPPTLVATADSFDATCLAQPGEERSAAARALLELQAAARKEPDRAQRWVAVGEEWVRQARKQARPAWMREVDACAEAALARSADDGGALALRALALHDEHRFVEARDLARRILARDPDDPMVWGLLSDAELELKRLDAAIDAAQRMLDLKPSLPAYGRAAHLRWLQGDAAGAKRLYELAIRAGAGAADREPSAYMVTQAALIFLHEGDHAGAEAGFDYALSLVPGYAQALAGKQRVALARGEQQVARGGR